MSTSRNLAISRILQLEQRKRELASEEARQRMGLGNAIVQGASQVATGALGAVREGQARMNEGLQAKADAAVAKAPGAQSFSVGKDGLPIASTTYGQTPEQEAADLFKPKEKPGSFFGDIGVDIENLFAAPGMERARAVAAQRIAEQRKSEADRWRTQNVEALKLKREQEHRQNVEKIQQENAELQTKKLEAQIGFQNSQLAGGAADRELRERLAKENREAAAREAERRRAHEKEMQEKELEAKRAKERREKADFRKWALSQNLLHLPPEQVNSFNVRRQLYDNIVQLKSLREKFTGAGGVAKVKNLFRSFVGDPEFQAFKVRMGDLITSINKEKDPDSAVLVSEAKRTADELGDGSVTMDSFFSGLDAIVDRLRNSDKHTYDIHKNGYIMPAAMRLPPTYRDRDRFTAEIKAKMGEPKTRKEAEALIKAVDERMKQFESELSYDEQLEAFRDEQGQPGRMILPTGEPYQQVDLGD